MKKRKNLIIGIIILLCILGVLLIIGERKAVEYEKKNENKSTKNIVVKRNDYDILKSIIKEQIKRGATVSEDIFNDNQYKWDSKTNTLIEIKWNQKNISGNLNLNELEGIKRIDVSDNNITTISINKLVKLKTLNCKKNAIKKLDLSELINLYEIDCSYNEIEEIDLHTLENLEQIDCSHNKLTSLDVSDLELLEFYLDCNDNELTELVLGNICLATLDCSNNELTYLDVSGLNELYVLRCQNNNIEYIKFKSPYGGAYDLRFINCKNNKLSSLNTGGITKLKTLKCDESVTIVKK